MRINWNFEPERMPSAMAPLHDAVEVQAIEASPRKGSTMSLASLAVLLVAVALAAVAQLVLTHGMTLAQHRVEASGGSLAIAAATSPWVIGGLAIFGVSAVAWMLTLSRVPLSLAYPFNALGYVGILTASVVFLHERTNVWTWLGTFLVAGGLVLVVTMTPRSS